MKFRKALTEKSMFDGFFKSDEDIEKEEEETQEEEPEEPEEGKDNSSDEDKPSEEEKPSEEPPAEEEKDPEPKEDKPIKIKFTPMNYENLIKGACSEAVIKQVISNLEKDIKAVVRLSNDTPKTEPKIVENKATWNKPKPEEKLPSLMPSTDENGHIIKSPEPNVDLKKDTHANQLPEYKELLEKAKDKLREILSRK
jgi:hypothetical protein